VIENSRFRELLLFFNNDLNDDDLPHRTKIRTAVMEAWKSWFIDLKRDLQVSLS
jgi:hypothetical protein